ncbi:MAG: transglycosylase domain-containing protein, partial [Candidatus Hydrogenedentes bacterium]|nr:transglycosylase domain-containing protein [Candidatus Hydrogenedentota bacterium]
MFSKQTSNPQETVEDPVPRRRGCGWIFVAFFLVVGACWGAGMAGFIWLLQDSKKTIAALETYIPEANSRVYDANGEVLGELTSGKEHRQLVGLNQVPLYMQKAVVATEDKTFYVNHGVDWLGFAKAALFKLSTGRMRGASTITMQVARLVDPLGVGRERTTARKLREILTSLRIERQFTKDEILELYLNLTFFGGRASGVQAAAQQYFAKDCWDLTLGECAMIAAVPRAPNEINPFRSMDSAMQHRQTVLDQMLENQFITQEEHDKAVQENLDEQVITPDERKQLAVEGKGVWSANKFKAPYFVEEVRQRLLTDEGKSDV